MNKKIIILASMVLLAGIGFAVWYHRPVPTFIQLDLDGTPGLKVAGTIIVDGDSREFSGVLPTQVTAEARNFEYKILMQEPRGKLSATLSTGTGVRTSVGTESGFAGVRGHYACGWFGKSVGASTARDGE